MASALVLLKRGLRHVRDVDGGPKKGIVGYGVETAVGFSASYALGRAHIKLRDSDRWAARHANKLVAIGGKLGAIAVDALAGPGYVANGVNTVGQAAVNAIGLQLGIEHEMRAQRRQVAITPPGVSFDPAKLPAGTKATTMIGEETAETVVGDIPPADPQGRWLSREQIDRILEMH